LIYKLCPFFIFTLLILATMKCIKIEVYGKVQGVWYRASTKNKAEELGVLGTVQNRKDGSVYIEAMGTDQLLKAFIEWCQEGPQFAEVERLAVQQIELQSFNSFEIIRV